MRELTPLHTCAMRAKSVLMALPVALALTLGVAGTAVLPTTASAQDLTEEHVRLAAQYAELSGANQLYVNALNAQRRDIIRALASTNPDIGPMITEVSDIAYVEMAESTGPLFQSIAEVYASSYPIEDLQVIVDFFQSDVGQRFLETRRDADQQAFQATISWGDEISVAYLARVRALLAERGVEL
ncbi:MAG: hypothetical protein Rhims3KO_26540 [Hyphomicrobiales bacterium]